MEFPIDRPLRLRRLLYTGAALLVLVGVVLAPSPRVFVLLGLAGGGLLTAWRGDDPPAGRILMMGSYDLGVALVLAALGMPYASLLVMIGGVAAVGLLVPSRVRPIGLAAAVVGGGGAFLALRVGGVASVIPASVAGEAFSLSAQMTAFAAMIAGLAWLFGSVGLRLREFAEAQEQLRASIDAQAAPTIIVRDDAIIYANPAAIVLTGQALVGESLRDTLGLDDLPPDGGTVRTSLGTSGHMSLTLDVETHPVMFDGLHSFQVTMTDVSDASADSVGPPAERRQLDLLFDRIPVALYRSTPAGDVTAANPAMAEMLGLSDPTELIGEVQRARTHYRDREGRDEWLAMFDGTDVVMNYEMYLTKADGSEITVTDSARAVRARDGSILFFEGVLVDVTEQREIEEARSRTSEILEATSDLVWLTDDADRVTRVNAAMRSFLGGRDDQFIGAHTGELILPGADSADLMAWQAAPDGERVWKGEVSLRSLDGTEILTSAVAQRHRNFVSLVARDITAERRTAGQLERLVKAKDEFIASVSHELRTPLTAVVGLASELVSFYDEMEESTKRDFIGLVADQASEVAAIVEDLLVAARADTDSITLIHDDVDLRTAIDTVVAAFPESKSSMFQVTGAAVACGDAQRVRQIVRNLITNAIRYGELPGTVELSIEGADVLLTVSDKGPGIDPEMIERIFQPYERAHTSVTQPNSVGLGLSVSRWLAEKMGGSLVYENDTMSTFILRLPATRCT